MWMEKEHTHTHKKKSLDMSLWTTCDFKKKIFITLSQVCEFAIGVTAGDNPRDVVPIAVRQPLLQTWVTAKQMAQQQITKTLGTDDDVSWVWGRAVQEGTREMFDGKWCMHELIFGQSCSGENKRDILWEVVYAYLGETLLNSWAGSRS